MSNWRKIKLALPMLTLCLLMPCACSANVVYVRSGSSAAAPDGASWQTAYATVQEGLNAAVSGDEVWVAAGTYRGKVTLKEGVKLYGGFAGAEAEKKQRNWVANPTVLDGGQAGSTVIAPQNTTSATTIDGFVIANGNAPEGGGIYCADSASPTIGNNLIISNNASQGSAIYCSANAAPFIVNNTITGNSGASGAVYCAATSAPAVINNIIAFNTSGGIQNTSGGPVLDKNCVYDNEGFDYSGLAAGATDIAADPEFVDQDAGDFSLQSDSPCVDAGDDSALQPDWLELNGQLRVYGASIDIGAYEWRPLRPSNGGLMLAKGTLPTGAKIDFTSTYTDPNGSDDILLSYLLINTSLNGANAAYVRYDAAENVIQLRDDANTEWTGGFAPGSANVIENSYCKVYCEDITVSGTGATLTIKWVIELKPVMAGKTYSAWITVIDDASLRDHWDQVGSFNVVNPEPQVPMNVGLFPYSGVFEPERKIAFTTMYFDPDGFENIWLSYLLFNTSLSGANGVHMRYDANLGILQLRDDANTEWTGGFAPGSANVIENSYCKVYCEDTTVSGSGTFLTIRWVIEFKRSMVGRTCYAWMTVIDDGVLRDNWDSVGSISVVNPGSEPPANAGLTPSSGTLTTGSKITLSSTYTDPNGPDDIWLGYLLINTSLNGANGVYLRYNANDNQLQLRNDADTEWTGGFAPGSANVIENSYCRLYCQDTTVVKSDDSLTIHWVIEIKPAMGGKVCSAWLTVIDDSALRDNWEKAGNFNVGNVAIAPIAAGVSPASATVSQPSWSVYTCIYSDGNGWADLSKVRLLVNGSVSASGAAYFIYDQNTNKLYGVSNAGAVIPAGGVTPGTGYVIETENAYLDCNGTTVSGSGNDLAVAWRIKYKPNMANKTHSLYMLAWDDGSLSSKWMQNGTTNIKYVNAGPAAVSVSPSSGSVAADTWSTMSAQYSDPNGRTNLYRVRLLVNTSVSANGAAYFIYDANANKLYGISNAGAYVGGYAPGSANVIETENAYLDCQSTTIEPASLGAVPLALGANGLKVNFRVKFKAGMAGRTLNTYLYAGDDLAAASGWVKRGTISVTGG